MTRRHFYIARLQSGAQTEFYVDENSSDIAHVQAKIEVERWVADEGDTVDRLVQFDMTHTTP